MWWSSMQDAFNHIARYENTNNRKPKPVLTICHTNDMDHQQLDAYETLCVLFFDFSSHTHIANKTLYRIVFSKTIMQAVPIQFLLKYY